MLTSPSLKTWEPYTSLDNFTGCCAKFSSLTLIFPAFEPCKRLLFL